MKHEEGKRYNMRISLEEREHDLLLIKQQHRKDHKLPFLSKEDLVKLYMLQGMHFEQQRRERSS